MAMIGGYQDSYSDETYPRQSSPDTTPEPPPAAPTVPPPSTAPAPTSSAPAPLPTFRIQPVDSAKFSDPNKRDAKYDFLRIAQRYDPRRGITPEMLAELNQLGYADFSGSGQHLSLSNIRGGGIDPHDFSGDFIQNWGGGNNPNAQWAWDWYDPNPQGQAAPAGTSGLEGAFSQWARGMSQPQMPNISIMQSGIDPQTLAALMATYATPQSQPASTPGYQPSAPQTQATPFTPGGASYGNSPVQTVSGAPAVAQTIDPFMLWLRQQLGGGYA